MKGLTAVFTHIQFCFKLKLALLCLPPMTDHSTTLQTKGWSICEIKHQGMEIPWGQMGIMRVPNRVLCRGHSREAPCDTDPTDSGMNGGVQIGAVVAADVQIQTDP